MSEDNGDIGLQLRSRSPLAASSSSEYLSRSFEHTPPASPARGATATREPPSPIALPDRPSLILRRSSSLASSRTARKPTSPQKPSQLSQTVPFPTTFLPDEVMLGLRRYVLCLAVVNFDLDVGPVLDNTYPQTNFSQSEQHDLAFSCLPDNLPTLDGRERLACTFSWRIPCDKVSAISKERASSEDGFLYGYTNFQLKRDDKLRRKYRQRSFALITHRPDLCGLFMAACELLSPMHDQSSAALSAMIEIACANIARWPPPIAGVHDYHFLGSVFPVEITTSRQAQTFNFHPGGQANKNTILILASHPSMPLSLLFQDMLPRLWLLFELCLLSEPIFVYCPSDVERCSQIVSWLQNLVKPLPFGSDYRPYFTIHCSDFEAVVNPRQPRQGVIIGCTNPLLFSACRHWPHILKSSAAFSNTRQKGVFGAISSSKSSPAFNEAFDAASGLFSPSKRILKRNDKILKQAQDLSKSGNFQRADEVLLQHFRDIAERFSEPVDRYFRSLQPSQEPKAEIFGHDGIRSFNNRDFLSFLSENEVALDFRRGAKFITPSQATSAVYRQWLLCPGFSAYLQERLNEAEVASRKRLLSLMHTKDIQELVQGQDLNKMVKRVEIAIAYNNETIANSRLVRESLDSASLAPANDGKRNSHLDRQLNRLNQLIIDSESSESECSSA